MNPSIITYSIRAVLLLIIQVYILYFLDIGQGIHIMIYPLFIFLLPVEMNIFYLMLIAFGFGGIIDIFNDTAGLHAASAVMFAYFRPIIFKLFAPRDGYDILMETNLFQMGFGWFLRTFGILILIHHLWFFLLEIFRISDILFILKNTGLSAVFSFVLCILYQQLFLRKPKKEA